MKKIIIILIITIIVIIGIFIYINKEYPDDTNTLYSVKFNKIKLRIEKYDSALGGNQLVVVKKSINSGKNYEIITEEPLIVSMEAKYIFLNEKLGFVVSKPNLSKSNNYLGLKVTHDGGKTFINSKINYDNPFIDILSVEDVPYMENDVLRLPCSIYQVKDDQSGYEDVRLILVSNDQGLTWNLNKDEVLLSLKANTLSSSSATFKLTNNTNKEYWYGPDYIIEQKQDGYFKEIVLDYPLTWNDIAYTLKANDEVELHINWEDDYGQLPKGQYRLVKKIFKEEDIPIDDSKLVYLYAEFDIK